MVYNVINEPKEPMRIFEYRLRPNRKQEQKLFDTLRATRDIYNQGLEELIDNYEKTKKHLSRFTHDRMHGSQKAGFPRFKSANHWHSIEFRDSTHHLDGTYYKSGKGCAGNIRTVVHRPIKGIFKHARIVKRPSGWYLQCVCETAIEPLPKTGKEIGLDVGLKVLIADSTGGFVENDKVLRKHLAHLRVSQRSVARKPKGSHNRRKKVRELARLHERIANRRRDYIHKVTTKIVKENDLIAMEDLQISNMSKNHHLALSIMDASWGMVRQYLSYKAAKAGRRFVAVPPHYTSQKCSKCGEMVQKALSVRTHLCPYCGYVDDRDTNAAKNILALARTEPFGAKPINI